MEYDEIDQYVDQLFRQDHPGSGEEILHGDVLSGDWRDAPFDQVILDVYDEVTRRRKQRPPANSNPQRGPPYVLWDAQMDEAAGMQGGIEEANGDDFETINGYQRSYGNQVIYYEEVRNHSLTCLEWVLVAGVVALLLVFIMISA